MARAPPDPSTVFHQTRRGQDCPGSSVTRRAGLLSVGGLAAWTEYGITTTAAIPDRQRGISRSPPPSRAVLQRERHGTLFADVERRLDLCLRAPGTGDPLAPTHPAPASLADRRWPGFADAHFDARACACPTSRTTGQAWRASTATGC